MNKKMTRVIGIVAVLVLLCVATVGAASADVDVILDKFAGEFDDTAENAYSWYNSDLTSKKTSLNVSGATEGTLSFDNATGVLTLTGDNSVTDTAKFGQEDSSSNVTQITKLHFRYSIQGKIGNHIWNGGDALNVSGTESSSNCYRIYAMDDDKYTIVLDQVWMDDLNSGYWFVNDTSGKGQSSVSLSTTYTESGQLNIRQNITASGVTVLISAGNESFTNVYYLSSTENSYTAVDGSVLDKFYIYKPEVLDYTATAISTDNYDPTVLTNRDRYTIESPVKSKSVTIRVFDPDGNIIEGEYGLQPYFDGLNTIVGDGTAEWGYIINNNDTEGNKVTVTGVRAYASDYQFTDNITGGYTFVEGDLLIFVPVSTPSANATLKDAYKISAVKYSYSMGGIYSEPVSMSYIGENEYYTDDPIIDGNYSLRFDVYLDNAGIPVTFDKTGSDPASGAWSTESTQSGVFTENKSQLKFVYDSTSNKLNVLWIVDKSAESPVEALLSSYSTLPASGLSSYGIKIGTDGGTPASFCTINDVKNATSSTKYYDITGTPTSFGVVVAYAEQDKVTLTYSPNGGVGLTQTTEHEIGDVIQVNHAEYNWDNTGTSTNSQTGWNTSALGTGTSYDLYGSSFTINEDTTLYAVWNFRTNSQDSTVKMITDPTFTFTIPSEVILSNTQNGIVGAEVGIKPDTSEGKFTTEKNIVMRLNTDALNGLLPGNNTAYSGYDTFDVTVDGVSSDQRTAGKFADYKLNVYTNPGLSTKLKSVNGKNNTASPKNNDVISVLGTNSEGVSAYLGYVTAKLPTYADTYTDTLNFIVSVEDSTQATEKAGYFNVYDGTTGGTEIGFTNVTINGVEVHVLNSETNNGTSVGTLKAGTEYTITKTGGLSFSNVMTGGTLTVYNGTTSKSVEFTITDDNTITFSLSVEDIAAMRDGANDAYNIRMSLSSSA